MKSIPWRIGQDDNLSLWLWETDDFKAKIQTDSYRSSFSWEIFDLTQGREDSLADGLVKNFREAEESIREIIGKSYPSSMGYEKYAGRFATTFTIFNGDRIDFGPMRATNVILTVRVADKKGGIKEKKIVGQLQLDSYYIKVAPEHGNTVRIPPSRIVSVKQEFGGLAKPIDEDPLGKALRIYPGSVPAGCTGKAGSLPNTVEHPMRAAICPIHEN